MTVILSVQGLQKKRDAQIFDPVSFTLAAGEGLGILGFNGSGKTTLLDIVAGLENPSAGQVHVQGRVGYAMQNAGFQDNLSFKDNLRIEALLCGLKGPAVEAEATKAAARMEVLPYWNKRYAKGSSGMKGRLGIAAAIIASPQLLLLDEAYSFLDEHSTEQAHEVLLAEKRRGAALLMVSHNPGDLQGLCERVLHLPQARIEAL